MDVRSFDTTLTGVVAILRSVEGELPRSAERARMLERAVDACTEAVLFARERRDSRLLVRSLRILGTALAAKGDLHNALRAVNETLQVIERAKEALSQRGGNDRASIQRERWMRAEEQELKAFAAVLRRDERTDSAEGAAARNEDTLAGAATRNAGAGDADQADADGSISWPLRPFEALDYAEIVQRMEHAKVTTMSVVAHLRQRARCEAQYGRSLKSGVMLRLKTVDRSLDSSSSGGDTPTMAGRRESAGTAMGIDPDGGAGAQGGERRRYEVAKGELGIGPSANEGLHSVLAQLAKMTEVQQSGRSRFAHDLEASMANALESLTATNERIFRELRIMRGGIKRNCKGAREQAAKERVLLAQRHATLGAQRKALEEQKQICDEQLTRLSAAEEELSALQAEMLQQQQHSPAAGGGGSGSGGRDTLRNRLVRSRQSVLHMRKLSSIARQRVDEQQRKWNSMRDATRAGDEGFINARRAWLDSARRLRSKESAVAAAVQRLELERIDTTTSLLRLAVDRERELLQSRLAALQQIDDAISTIAPHSDLRLMLHGRAVAAALRVIASDEGGTPSETQAWAMASTSAEADLVAASGGPVTRSSRTFAKRRGQVEANASSDDDDDDDVANDEETVVGSEVKLSTLTTQERRAERNAKREMEVDMIMGSVFRSLTPRSPAGSTAGTPSLAPTKADTGAAADAEAEETEAEAASSLSSSSSSSLQGVSPDQVAAAAAAAAAAILDPNALATPPHDDVVEALFHSATGRRIFIRRLNQQRSHARTLSGIGFLRLKVLLDRFLDACVRNTDIKAASMAMIMSQTFYKSAQAPPSAAAAQPAAKEGDPRRKSRRRSLHEYMQVSVVVSSLFSLSLLSPRCHPPLFTAPLTTLSLSLCYSLQGEISAHPIWSDPVFWEEAFLHSIREALRTHLTPSASTGGTGTPRRERQMRPRHERSRTDSAGGAIWGWIVGSNGNEARRQSEEKLALNRCVKV